VTEVRHPTSPTSSTPTWTPRTPAPCAAGCASTTRAAPARRPLRSTLDRLDQRRYPEPPRAAYQAGGRRRRSCRLAEQYVSPSSRWRSAQQLERFTEEGLYPYSRFYLTAIKERSGHYWDNHFSTIGLVGMNEACRNLIGCGIDTAEGRDLAEATLQFMRKQLEAFQE
jgi:hypothetical protein